MALLIPARNAPTTTGTGAVQGLDNDDPEVLALWREAMKGQEGGNKRSEEAITNNNIIGGKSTQGTSLAYTLSRLQRQRPDLFEKVAASSG